MTQKVILCDLDDTLIKTQQEYDYVTNLSIDTLIHYTQQPLDRNEILAEFHMLNVQNAKKGEIPWHFVDTMVELYKKYNTKINRLDMKRVYDSAFQIFERKIEMYQGAYSFIKYAKSEGALFKILTLGAEEVQSRRVRDAGIEDLVDDVFIVDKHKEQVIQTIADQYGHDNVIMFGNSESSDIKPALEVGVYGLHIIRDTWAFDNYDLDYKNHRYHKVHDYDEAFSKLKLLGFV